MIELIIASTVGAISGLTVFLLMQLLFAMLPSKTDNIKTLLKVPRESKLQVVSRSEEELWQEEQRQKENLPPNVQ